MGFTRAFACLTFAAFAINRFFVLVVGLLDNRLGIDGTFPSYVADDLRTPFASATLNSRVRYATLSPASSAAAGVPWTGLRFFRGHITQDNFRSMVRDINAYDAFSEDVRSYDITSFGLLHEIGYAPNSNISMGVHIYDLGVWNFRLGGNCDRGLFVPGVQPIAKRRIAGIGSSKF